MVSISDIISYVLTFFALYVQVFFLLMVFKTREQIKKNTSFPPDVNWPAVTIMVPCWNEEETIVKTVDSLLAVDYPKDKLIIKVVDDGSTDNTWQVIQKFQGVMNVDLIRKENGGKHTAMNLIIATATTEYIGNLDADTFIEPNTLKKTMWQFLSDKDMMAVSPAIVIHEPKGFLQKAQDLQFNMFIPLKKVLSLMNGIHVTQGQFSIYRKKVFDDLGPYKNAHRTEDLEIAYRMQVNGYKIGQCHDAFVHTTSPNTLKDLYKQRLRWMYGFINNSYDYRRYLFKSKYGVFSLFTVPIGLLYIVTTLFGTAVVLFGIGNALYHLVSRLLVTNFHTGEISFFFVNARPLIFIYIVLILFFIIMAIIGKKIRGKKPVPDLSFIFFFLFFNFIASVWLFKAVYNTLVTRKEVAWR
ncbi:hypothetical protein A2917_02015 [Candidatus Nomurabacteria bacterium RIFCSPLOWO2_01_FULL_42_17]|uniref:Glycosyltransferase 2-like domain-containing protein n=1 Tax=Candidatus Nomurabacteria bacterium RIFCSPLOWO2_01_FULL_42_17 TaxID=1801780 RepID=A0A1F6XMA2_9BACT|nr:MAG: hypothetical protein A2917_02015 [Candidatus Nomurabacteria bacterium RIFCSPLOWO2_01_FULL_42_17]